MMVIHVSQKGACAVYSSEVLVLHDYFVVNRHPVYNVIIFPTVTSVRMRVMAHV